MNKNQRKGQPVLFLWNFQGWFKAGQYGGEPYDDITFLPKGTEGKGRSSILNGKSTRVADSNKSGENILIWGKSRTSPEQEAA